MYNNSTCLLNNTDSVVTTTDAVVPTTDTVVTTTDTLYMQDYPIDSLPDFIIESSLYKCWYDLCPNETIFSFLKCKMVDNLEIHSHYDFQKLIDADAMFQFTANTHNLIFKNMYNFWINDSNSSKLELPIKDFTHFGNQVRALFLEKSTILPVKCFQYNYVDLFEYLLERDGLSHIDSGRFPDYSLPYYGAVNNHIEIVRRGLEVGVSVAKDVMDAAIKQKNLEMFNLLREYKVKYTSKTLEEAAKSELPEIYEYFLKVAINNNLLRKYVFNTLNNKNNLRYLLEKSGTDLSSIDGIELLEECINESYSVEIIQMIDVYFSKINKIDEINEPDKTIETNKTIETLMNTYAYVKTSEFRYIDDKVIYNDDLELFMYLHSKGFLLTDHKIDYAIEMKTRNLTPGFLRKKLAEQMNKLNK